MPRVLNQSVKLSVILFHIKCNFISQEERRVTECKGTDGIARTASVDNLIRRFLILVKYLKVVFDNLNLSEQPTPNPQRALTYATKENFQEEEVIT